MAKLMEQREAEKVLGLTGSYDAAQLKAAYRAHMRKYHPDLYPAEPQPGQMGKDEAEKEFVRGGAAYEALSVLFRGHYDGYTVQAAAGGGSHQTASQASQASAGSQSQGQSRSQGGQSTGRTGTAGQATGGTSGGTSQSTWSNETYYTEDKDYEGKWVYDQDSGWVYEVHRRQGAQHQTGQGQQQTWGSDSASRTTGGAGTASGPSGTSRKKAKQQATTPQQGGYKPDPLSPLFEIGGGPVFWRVIIAIIIFTVIYTLMGGDNKAYHFAQVIYFFFLNYPANILVLFPLWLLYISGN